MLDRKEYDKILAECREISVAKNTDYGCETMRVFGSKGIVVRLNDKMHRLINLVWHNQDPKVNDEKVEDTAKDMINYAIYLVMMQRGKLEK
jgi:hypothetical protein